MSVVLWMQINSYIVSWDRVYKRILSHPREASHKEGTSTVLLRALSRRIDDYPPFHVVEALVKAYPPAAWQSSSNPLQAACRRRASLSILELLVRSNATFQLQQQEAPALEALWNSYLNLHDGSSNELIEFVCTSGREGAMIWTKLYLILQYYTSTRECWKPLLAAANTPSCGLKLFQVILAMFPEQVKETDNDGRLPLHLVVTSSTNLEKTRDDETAAVVELKVRFLLECCKDAAQKRDCKGRLPLHCAISSNQSLPCLQALISAWPEALLCRDEDTCLYPFQLAAVSDCSLDIIYKFIRVTPHLVSTHCEGNKNCGKHVVPLECQNDLQDDNDTESRQHVGGNRAKLQQLLECIASSGDEVLWNGLHQLLLARHNDATTSDGWHALHAAAYTKSCPVGLLKLVIRMHPDQVRLFNDNGCLPIHLAASTPTLKESDKVLLELEDREEEDNSAAGRCGVLLDAFPKGARVRNKQGLLALHLAIMAGQPWECLDLLVRAWPNGLVERDGDMLLYPFMVAAATNRTCLSTVYRLLRATPHLVSAQS